MKSKRKPYAKIIRSHVRGCGAVRCAKDGSWDSPWACPADSEDGGAGQFLGKRRRYCLVLRCNDTRCPGLLAVDLAWIAAMAHRAELAPKKRAKHQQRKGKAK